MRTRQEMIPWVAAVGLLLWLGGWPAGFAAEKQAAGMAHGFFYKHEEIEEKPLSIHVVKVDLANSNLMLHTTLGKGGQFGLSTLSEQVRTLPRQLGRPIAAINGDYYWNEEPYVGDPKGLQIMNGELVSGPCDWTCFWLDPAGQPHMTNVISRFEVTWPNGTKTPFDLNQARPADKAVLFTTAVGSSTHTTGGRELVLEQNGTNSWLPLRVGQTYSARVREIREQGDAPLARNLAVLSLGKRALTGVPEIRPGADLLISTATSPQLTGAITAIGGGPSLIRDSKVVARDDGIQHPRTAIGWNKEFLFLVEVDGRQRYLSVGMRFPELANYMLKLGCAEAMSLDGGGSATCWVYGQVVNSPSEGQERGMANALVLVQKK